MTRRLLISYLLLTALVLAVLEIPLGMEFAHRQEDELTGSVERDAFALAGFVEDALEEPSGGAEGPTGEQPLDLQALAETYQSGSGGRVVIVDDQGRAMADSSPPAEGERYFDTRPEISRALSGEVATGTRSSETLGERIVYVAVPVASGGTVHGAVRITYPTSEVDQATRENWLRLGAVAVITLALAAGIGITLARSVTRPLRELQVAATSLGRGDLSARAPVHSGPPEVREVARAFNDMANRLSQLVDAQEEFVAEASHQLRSPLTALRLRLENLEASVPEPSQSDIAAAATETRRMSRLVDGLLTLARADRSSPELTAEDLDLGQLLDQRRSGWEPVAAEHGVRIEVIAPGQAVVRAARDRVEQTVDNLLANAIDASPPGGTVRLSALAKDGSVELHLADQGPGLSPEERTRAFDRFWRASQEGGALGGTGLGLAIVQKLVTADGGTVELREADGGGVEAVVAYPALDA